MKIILLLTLWLALCSAEKKQEYLCVVTYQLEGVVLHDCYNWWSAVYYQWKNDVFGGIVVVVVMTDSEFKEFDKQRKELKEKWNQKLAGLTEEEARQDRLLRSKAEHETEEFVRNAAKSYIVNL
jgi:hypothetical protein